MNFFREWTFEKHFVHYSLSPCTISSRMGAALLWAMFSLFKDSAKSNRAISQQCSIFHSNPIHVSIHPQKQDDPRRARPGKSMLNEPFSVRGVLAKCSRPVRQIWHRPGAPRCPCWADCVRGSLSTKVGEIFNSAFSAKHYRRGWVSSSTQQKQNRWYWVSLEVKATQTCFVLSLSLSGWYVPGI